MLTIGDITEAADWIDDHVKNKVVNEKFMQQSSLRGIVVLKNQLPIGHIPRAHFHQKIGTLYGYNLYMGRGDKVLLYVTECLKACIAPPNFLGHIGGDDFVAILPHYESASLCEKIIHCFEQQIHTFYDPEHLTSPPLVKNRHGELVAFLPMTLSIAAVSNQCQHFATENELGQIVAQVKKQCKAQEQSCYLLHQAPLAVQ